MDDLLIENYLKALDLFNRAKVFIQKKRIDIAKLSLEKALLVFPSEYIPQEKKELFQLKKNIILTLKGIYNKSPYKKKIKISEANLKIKNIKTYKYLYFVILLILFFSILNLFLTYNKTITNKLLKIKEIHFLNNIGIKNFKSNNLLVSNSLVEKQKNILSQNGINVANLSIYRGLKKNIMKIDIIYNDSEEKKLTAMIFNTLDSIQSYFNLESIILNFKGKNKALFKTVQIDINLYNEFIKGKISGEKFRESWKIK